MNVVFLLGRLGKEPEIKENATGEWAKLSIATSNYSKDKQKGTDWHDVVLFNFRSMVYLKEKAPQKGDQVLVEGRISYNKKDDKTYTSIIASNITIISSKPKADPGLESREAKDFENKMDIVKDVFPEAEIPF